MKPLLQLLVGAAVVAAAFGELQVGTTNFGSFIRPDGSVTSWELTIVDGGGTILRETTKTAAGATIVLERATKPAPVGVAIAPTAAPSIGAQPAVAVSTIAFVGNWTSTGMPSKPATSAPPTANNYAVGITASTSESVTRSDGTSVTWGHATQYDGTTFQWGGGSSPSSTGGGASGGPATTPDAGPPKGVPVSYNVSASSPSSPPNSSESNTTDVSTVSLSSEASRSASVIKLAVISTVAALFQLL